MTNRDKDSSAPGIGSTLRPAVSFGALLSEQELSQMMQGKTAEEKKTLIEEFKLDHQVQNHMEFDTEQKNLEENKK